MDSPDHNRVREIFHQAVDLTEQDRPVFLEQQCGDNTKLREAVERLLRHHRPNTLLLESEKQTMQLPAESFSDSIERRTRGFGDTVTDVPTESAVGLLERQSQVIPRRNKQRRLVIVVSSVCLLALLMFGWWLNSAIEESVSYSLRVGMQGMLDQQVRAIEAWLDTEEELVTSWAHVPDVVGAVENLDAITRTAGSTPEQLREAEAQDRLKNSLNTITRTSGPFNYAVWNREGTLLADSNPDSDPLIGNATTEYGASLLARVFGGDTVVWLPSRAGFITKGFVLSGGLQKAYLALITPVFRPGEERPFAAMLLSHPSRQERFEDLLFKAQFGETGEVYAIAEDGYLITESRFVGQLRTVDLVEDSPDSFSSQVVRVADPGGDLTDGFRSELPRGEWPLTRAATATIQGLNGGDFDGYRDYRGVDVIGVWAWMPKHRFGLIAEVDYANAYGALSPLHRAFGIIFAALILAALTAAGASLALVQLRQKNGESTRVGPYTLKALLGEGGFARVYLANHALLKRPTAIKILKPDQITPKNLIRFEREVQLASGLTHPNTINIYDYGATTDGSFYYAMEYIKGPSLQELIESDGPQTPERVVWILAQICRSLREAHERGLIHRDIKPQNIMLCRRGGEYDFVKVLDFGLARSFEADNRRVTETKLLIGTPLYIAPERIVDPTCMDPRSDIYSLGILGYYLLTGREPFDASGSIDALAQAINRSARRPSEQSPSMIPQGLDQLIRDCHSRVITERPQTAAEVLIRLDAVVLKTPWTPLRATAWWEEHRPTLDTEARKSVAALASVAQATPSKLLPKSS